MIGMAIWKFLLRGHQHFWPNCGRMAKNFALLLSPPQPQPQPQPKAMYFECLTI